MSFGTTPLSTTSLGANQFPVSGVAVPGHSGGNLTALEGGPASTDSNGNETAPASMYIKDGGDVTQGTSTDANTVNSVMGRLTKIRDLLNATLTVSGTLTEANSASIKSDLDAINTAIGAVSDAAWSGSGSGSEIAILKKIVAELAATLTVSGTVTANAGSGTFTNQQSNVTADYDSGAGTQNLTMFGVALPANGGAVAGGTSSNPVRTDPTGTTTQPVSGTVTANAGTNLNTSLLALESGGNLASIKTDADSIATNTSNTATNTSNTATNTSNTATVLGATSDVAVTGDNTGTVSAKMRGLTKILADIWDSTNHLFAMNVKQINGIAPTMGNGVSGTGVQRVTVASDSTGVLGATQSGTWTMQPGNTANTTPWLTKLSDGVHNVSAFSPSAGPNALVVAPTWEESASLTAGSLNANLLASTDVSEYKLLSIQVTGTWSGTLTFQGSNDNSTWNTTSGYSVAAPKTSITTVTTNGLYGIPLIARYHRIAMTAYTSGTANGTAEFYTEPVTYP